MASTRTASHTGLTAIGHGQAGSPLPGGSPCHQRARLPRHRWPRGRRTTRAPRPTGPPARARPPRSPRPRRGSGHQVRRLPAGRPRAGSWPPRGADRPPARDRHGQQHPVATGGPPPTRRAGPNTTVPQVSRSSSTAWSARWPRTARPSSGRQVSTHWTRWTADPSRARDASTRDHPPTRGPARPVRAGRNCGRYRQHHGGGAGPAVQHRAGGARPGRQVGAAPSLVGHRGDPHPVEHADARPRSGARAGARARPAPTGCARRPPTPAGHPASTHRPTVGQPLLGRPAADRPAGGGHARGHATPGRRAPRARSAGPGGPARRHQAGGHRRDLPAPPAGDHAPPLERAEPVAGPVAPRQGSPSASPRSPGGCGRRVDGDQRGPRASRPRAWRTAEPVAAGSSTGGRPATRALRAAAEWRRVAGGAAPAPPSRPAPDRRIRSTASPAAPPSGRGRIEAPGAAPATAAPGTAAAPAARGPVPEAPTRPAAPAPPTAPAPGSRAAGGRCRGRDRADRARPGTGPSRWRRSAARHLRGGPTAPASTNGSNRNSAHGAPAASSSRAAPPITGRSRPRPRAGRAHRRPG